MNNEFYKKLKNYTETVIQLLDGHLKQGEQIPVSIEFTHYRPVPQALVGQYQNEIENLSVFKSSIGYLSNLQIVENKVIKNLEKRSSCFQIYLLRFLFYFIKVTQLIKFSTDIFNKLYKEFEDYLCSDKFKYKAIAPLFNFLFEQPLEEINLGEVKIKRLPEEEKEKIAQLFQSPIPFHPKSREVPYPMIYKLEELNEIEKTKLFQWQELDKTRKNFFSKSVKHFDEIISTARIFQPSKPSKAGYDFIYLNPINQYVWYPFPQISSFHQLPQEGDSFTLKEEELLDFKKLWEEIRSVREPSLKIAINRFNLAYEREDLKDKLIDFVIALEALYYKSGDKGELIHKLSVRTARFLGSNYKNKDDIRKKIRDIYDKRSRAVHGKEEEVETGLIVDAEKYLRKSIRKFIKLMSGDTKDTLINKIDLA